MASNTSTCFLAGLPQELHDSIVSCFKGETQMLKHCALTWKKWHEHASLLLYFDATTIPTEDLLGDLLQRIRLKRERGARISKLNLIGNKQRRTKRSTLYGWSISNETVFELFTLAPNMTSLHIDGFTWESDGGKIEALERPDLHLSIQNSAGDGSADMFGLLRESCNLNSFDLGVWNSPWWFLSSVPPATINIQALNLTIPPKITDDVLATWPRFDGLTTVKITNTQPHAMRWLMTLLARNARTLTSGHLHVYPTSLNHEQDGWKCSALRHCIELRSFTIELTVARGAMWAPRPSHFPIQIARNLPTTTSHLNIVINADELRHAISGAMAVDFIDWTMLGATLPATLTGISVKIYVPLPKERLAGDEMRCRGRVVSRLRTAAAARTLQIEILSEPS